MALCAVGLHFVIGTVLAFTVVYSDEWILECSAIACGSDGLRVAIYGFLIFDIVLFLVAWGLTFVLSSKGWWRVSPPLAGIGLTLIAAAVSLNWVLSARS